MPAIPKSGLLQLDPRIASRGAPPAASGTALLQSALGIVVPRPGFIVLGQPTPRRGGHWEL